MAALSWGALRLARAESAEPASAVEAPAQ